MFSMFSNFFKFFSVNLDTGVKHSVVFNVRARKMLIEEMKGLDLKGLNNQLEELGLD